jgi:two-component sensor histidine kinase
MWWRRSSQKLTKVHRRRARSSAESRWWFGTCRRRTAIRRAQVYIDDGIVSRAAVPIKALSGPPLGVLTVDSMREHIYDEHDIDFLTGFANVLVEAVATGAQNEALRASIASMTAMVAEQDRLLNERNLLALEVQHRVRNNLQPINDMVTTQLRQTSDEGGR